ncbi:uncharacterized protein LOC102809096 [Saccoglossus kowalevskii]|uniref:Uncharacterized protein LOC102809096 isoform X1 n=1 Tax=Saccoglossus kowalevskii TaxID=10224 RepID=A0ABM0MI17_SACKO|nr:PREDICTED: uncharacterized protein LOC102809096 isoform X1 [Saccoglossus kowalevskii]XP_006819659.1 PREDICTED: uncharacterized protein LOC102809096 isoform X2 [Saccoglossus kowalevskii]
MFPVDMTTPGIHIDTRHMPLPTIVTSENDDRLSVIGSIADKSRSGSRFSDEEKNVVFGLSGSFSRRRLGKQQQVLQDIAKRCREQEIADMSSRMTTSLNLGTNSKQDGYQREVSMYMTNTLLRRGPKTTRVAKSTSHTSYSSLRPGIERSATITNFRPSNVIRKVPINYPIKTMFPKVSPRQVTYGGLSPTELYNRTKHLHNRKINGPIQMEHYMYGRHAPCAPLMLPSLTRSQQHGHHSSPIFGERNHDIATLREAKLQSMSLMDNNYDEWIDLLSTPPNSEH